MESTDELLVATCRTMIKTVLSCLDNAMRGTIYKIGPMPDLTAVRVLSGTRIAGPDEFEWGLPPGSDYNPPGKSWEQYRDQPGRALEAMGWCVERQMSWTAENPLADPRSVRKQLAEQPEDEFHMEPVVVRKKSLYGGSLGKLAYPVDWQGNMIWQDNDYVVAAVLKIHFKTGTLRCGDRQTRILHDLSKSLGSELLSLWFREKLFRASKDFARQRLQSCEILAHELRNTLVKLGFVFSAINAQIAILRESWEDLLRRQVPGLEWKKDVLEILSGLLNEKYVDLQSFGDLFAIGEKLLVEQRELANISLSPYQEQQWVRNKIYPKWERLLSETDLWDPAEIHAALDRLFRALRTGMDFDHSASLNGCTPELLGLWSRIAYLEITSGNLDQLDDAIRLLEYPGLPVYHKEQILRVFKSLKALVHTIPEVEEKTAKILQSLRYGAWAEDQYSFDSGIPDLDLDGGFGISLAD